MASGQSDWISPRKRFSSPKRRRVNELRQKFEALAGKPYEHHEPEPIYSSSPKHSPERGHGWGPNDYDESESSHRSNQNYDESESSHRSKQNYDETESSHRSGRNDPSYQYEDSEEEYDEPPSFSNVKESSRIDGREPPIDITAAIWNFDDRAKLASGMHPYDIQYEKLGQSHMDWYLNEMNKTPPPRKTDLELLEDLFPKGADKHEHGFTEDRSSDGNKKMRSQSKSDGHYSSGGIDFDNVDDYSSPKAQGGQKNRSQSKRDDHYSSGGIDYGGLKNRFPSEDEDSDDFYYSASLSRSGISDTTPPKVSEADKRLNQFIKENPQYASKLPPKKSTHERYRKAGPYSHGAGRGRGQTAGRGRGQTAGPGHGREAGRGHGHGAEGGHGYGHGAKTGYGHGHGAGAEGGQHGNEQQGGSTKGKKKKEKKQKSKEPKPSLKEKIKAMGLQFRLRIGYKKQ